ncbi:ACSL5 [Bugula neritina]|uniref:long-chain-fatty-acid--CoA ligase n=1 Tax=Bugula neritina TaxID=10212 RepID=A0A7J7IZ03_BUGNE|nr:ACSL5 [Bugula neritina]
MAGASKSRIKSYLLKKALHKKEKYFKRGIITKSTLWDKLVFKKLQDLLGGRVKIIVTGAAPISTPVLRFFRLAFGAVVCEGYGQTECSAAMSGSVPGEQEYGEVGPPLSCNIIKLADVPEMNYFAAENVGEVCCKGINVFKGYLHDEAKTREAIDEDGWLHTGDIGRWTERGTLKIVDRKKNIFKLSQGEYVAPEKIENVYMSCSLVAQCFVHGDSLQSALVGVVVPDPETLPAYAKSELGLSTTSMEELCKNEKVKAAVMKAMASAAKTFNLKGFEQVRDIHMVAEAFTVENNLLTPTFKLKRVESRTKYKDVIAEMYSKMK